VLVVAVPAWLGIQYGFFIVTPRLLFELRCQPNGPGPSRRPPAALTSRETSEARLPSAGHPAGDPAEL
jgi:hypothetical protein